MEQTLITIAIPCYRSEHNIEAVADEIRSEFSKHEEYDYQIVLVNDGSPDDTFGAIRRICEKDKKVVGVNLSRNFTQANARMAALPYVKGDVLIYMDDDGQHPAEGIFTLAAKVQEGYDVVFAHLTNKKTSRFKIVTSDLFNALSVKFDVKPKGIKNSAFVALSRFAADQLLTYKSPSPSYSNFLYRVTTKYANVSIEQRKRLSGESGYTLKKLVNLAIESLTNFTVVPLHLMMGFGASVAGIGFLTAIVLIVKKLVNPAIVMGYTSLMSVILILGGIIMAMIGLVGEYIGRVYMMLSDLPQYVVREVLNDVQP